MTCTALELVPYSVFGKQLVTKAFKNRVPISGSIELNFRCNMRCAHCYVAYGHQGVPGKQELTRAEIDNLFAQVTDMGTLWMLLSIPLAVLLIIILRRQVRRKHIIAAVIVIIVLGIVETLLGEEQSSGLVIPIGAALMFLAGVLLLEHTQLAHIRLFDRDYLGAGKSFLWGCVLAVPPALLNLVTTQLTPPSEFDRLFDRWWEPFYALQPGILEEIWARLLLVTLLYALLRPTSGGQPRNALLGAMLIAAFIHGAAHFPGSITNPLEGIFMALMYGIPLVLLYVKRDLEHAIGYHFFIDFIRFTAFVLWNTAV